MGRYVQMMSWDSDVFCFRCENTRAYSYKISESTLTPFNIPDLVTTAPMPFPSGELFYHQKNIYNANGQFVRTLNVEKVEHSCLGQLSNGDDAYFAIAFEEGPNTACQGSLVAHNATNGNCFSVTPPSDYGYPKSGTHISALAHTNTQKGWVAVSMLGYQLDGQGLFDQELFIAKVNENNADVYRIGHHRSDKSEFGYFGEPHVTISPSGTRVLYGSDWSGAEDGKTLDSYVAELPAQRALISSTNAQKPHVGLVIYPNPASERIHIQSPINPSSETKYQIYDVYGKIQQLGVLNLSEPSIDLQNLKPGMYTIKLSLDAQNNDHQNFMIQ